MSEPESHQGGATVAADPPPGMTAAALDEVLEALGVVAAEVVAAARAADERMELLNQASEAILERREGMHGREPDPRSAYISWQSDLSIEVAERYRAVAREFVAWWADLATLAVVAPLLGRAVHPARATAAEPDQWFTVEDLAHLPPVPDDVRDLAGLSIRMASAPLHVSPEQSGDDLRHVSQDYLARAGLMVGRDERGELIAEDDGSPEGRRCRLWGADWVDDNVPTLPSAAELAELLTGHGVSADVVTDVRDAAAALESAVAARRRARELDSAEPDDAEQAAAQLREVEALWNEADRITDLLAAYAHTMTTATAAARAATTAA